jgi:hypothetical protein
MLTSGSLKDVMYLTELVNSEESLNRHTKLKRRPLVNDWNSMMAFGLDRVRTVKLPYDLA